MPKLSASALDLLAQVGRGEVVRIGGRSPAPYDVTGNNSVVTNRLWHLERRGLVVPATGTHSVERRTLTALGRAAFPS